MPKKYLFFSAIAAALLFGVSVGGCNRDSSRTAMRSNKNRQSQPIKPAEVLSATAFRPAPRAPQPLPPPVAPMQYNNYAMIPPTPVQPVAAPVPTMSPTLAMAQPTMYAAPVPVQYVLPEPIVYAAPPAPVHPVVVAMAPIPELEPARAYRLPTRRTGNRPVAEIMISERAPTSINRQEVIRALAPIEAVPTALAPQPAPQAWVASPVTAMTTSRPGY